MGKHQLKEESGGHSPLVIQTKDRDIKTIKIVKYIYLSILYIRKHKLKGEKIKPLSGYHNI